MLYNICRRCQKPTPYPTTVCETCKVGDELDKQERKLEAARRYDKKRERKYIRFYNNKAWKQLSQAYMQAHGYRCERCDKIATEVHHIKPIQTEAGWLRRFDWDNLMAVCVMCHNKEHGRFQ